MTKTREPAVEGWFTLDEDAPALLGTCCTTCGSFFFPKETMFCRNPYCRGTDFDEVELSRRGTVWSYTTNHYEPPEPYVSADPFEPYTVAAVQLADEGMVVLGQVKDADSAKLTIGQEVELVLDTLFEDDEHEYVVWKWQPVG